MSRFDTDITERLRWDKRYTLGHVPVTLEDAAAEVERLRAENQRLRGLLREVMNHECALPDDLERRIDVEISEQTTKETQS